MSVPLDALKKILAIIEKWDSHDSPVAVEEMCEIREIAGEALADMDETP